MRNTKNKYIKFNREYDMTIHQYPLAFNLLAVIAQRAKRTQSFNNNNLEFGEALIGDYKNYGMTRQQYRTILTWLKSTNQVATRTTNRGTIAKLVNTSIFDINIDQINHRSNPQPNQKATIKQPLTKNVKNEKKLAACVKAILSYKGEKAWVKDGTLYAHNKPIPNPVGYWEKIKANERPLELEVISKPAKEMTDKELREFFSGKSIGETAGIDESYVFEALERGLSV